MRNDGNSTVDAGTRTGFGPLKGDTRPDTEWRNRSAPAKPFERVCKSGASTVNAMRARGDGRTNQKLLRWLGALCIEPFGSYSCLWEWV